MRKALAADLAALLSFGSVANVARLKDQSRVAAFARRYRSFDAASGAYPGFDGYRHHCR